MLVPLEWMRQYVDCDLPVELIAERLTLAGLEVEGIESVGEPMPNVVVGRILSIEKHANADRLVVCDVDVGGASRHIVCGATNMKVGDKVPTALVGATLPGGFMIEKRPLRGVPSEGMMCSEAELGMGEDADGLLILADSAPVGTRFDEYAKLDDKVFDVSLNPNRPDCACMVGIARELAALVGSRLREPSTELIENGPPVEELTRVDVPDADLCPRYTARVVTDVTVGPSPMWMAERLRRGGLRPINNIVDATNYVLLELGHPLHAFDYDKLGENRIVVRRARAGESITTIDDVERKLTGNMLVIADADAPAGLAGIMGGMDSEISGDTRRVLLESACFQPQSIRRTSKMLGLMTEASYRFERGTDIELVPGALDRAAQLIAELAGGRVATGTVDVYPSPTARREVTLRPNRARRMLGCRISTGRMNDYLERLGFDVAERNKNLVVTVPARRVDVSMESDLIEEIGRLHGYDRLPSKAVIRPDVVTRDRRRHDTRNLVRDVLAAAGFSEAISYSFISPQLAADAGFSDHADRMLRIRNPLSSEQNAMRMSLIPGLLSAVRANHRRGRPDCRMFEIGRVFLPREGQPLPHERVRLAFAASGLAIAKSWATASQQTDLFMLKGVIETLADRLGISSPEFAPHHYPFLEPLHSFSVKFDRLTVGCLGAVLSVSGEETVYICELDIHDLISRRVPDRFYTRISQYPPSYRDLALVVPENVAAGDVEATLRTAAGETLAELRLFDLYRGRPQVPAGKKSLAYSLTFIHNERTLTDQEIDTVIKTIEKQLADKHDATLRSQ